MMLTTLFVVVPIIACVLISFFSTSILYKMVFLGLALFLFSTIGLFYINTLLRDNITKSKELYNTKPNNPQNKKSNYTKNSKNNTKPQYTKKEINNEDYKILVETLKYCMQNKLLDRSQVLEFKKSVNEHLGENVKHYGEKFKFENDMHEIYCKIKNKHLTSEDYKDLLLKLNNFEIA